MHSLKFRITLGTLLAVLVGLWSLSFYASRMLREDMEELLGKQQLSVAAYLASEADQEFDHRLKALAITAAAITPEMLGKPAALQSFLGQHPVTNALFNGGILAIRQDGTAVAESPVLTGRIGVNYMDREHVAAALREGKSLIGHPTIGKKLNRPLFSMASPIRDEQGKVIGALVGAIDLGKPNFLEGLEHTYGMSGGYLLIASQKRLIVMASDKNRIMEALPAPGINPLIDRFTEGLEGHFIFVNPLGVEVITAVKQVPKAGWYVAVTVPTVEAFAPIRAMQRHMLAATLVISLLLAALVWWLLRRQLAPMASAAKALAILAGSSQRPEPLPIARQDEVGELLGGFNHLISALTLQNRRAEALLELPNYADQTDEAAFMQRGLDLAEDLTGSLISFMHLVNDDEESIELVAWSKRTLEQYCHACFDKHYPVSQAGIWADAVRHKQPVVFNDYANYQLKRGLPPGHSELQRLISVPVIENGKVVMLAGVGNKPADYGDRDVETLQLIANAVWHIAQRQRAAKKIGRFSRALELSLNEIYIFNSLTLRFVDVNLGARTNLGYTLEELRQMDALQINPEFSAESYDALVAPLRSGAKKHIHYSTVHRRKNDTRYPVEVHLELTEDEPPLFVAIILDTTDQKRAESAIRESKMLLQRVIDSTPDWVYVKDREHRFRLVNEPFAKAFKQSPDGMIGRYDTDFLPLETSGVNPDHSKSGLHDADAAVFGGQTIRNPGEIMTFGNGETRVFDTFMGPLLDASQNIYGMLCYRRDITERYNKEQQHQALERQLLQAQKMEMIGHLAGGIAHDFNNLLASMLGFAEILQMSADIRRDRKLSQYVQEILQAGIRGKELVAQLLTFSHRRETPTEAIPVMPIVREVTKLLRSTMPTTITMKTSIAKSLPEVLISPVQLHQILMNLGINARDAILGKGAIEIKVEPAVLNDAMICSSCHKNFNGDYVMISVWDSGAGIPPENLLKIFDPFFSTKEVGQGSGLGLSVVHGIVHSANGHIEVRSVPGAGTRFGIYLPAQPLDARYVAHGLESAGDVAALGGHVLVVDDEASIVGFMTVLLENLGCRVTGLTSSTEAFSLFHDNPYDFDLVITDQSMPDLTGAELARAVLARRPDLPIVLATGYNNLIDEEAARQIGIRRFLIKPVPARVFADVINECLGGKLAGG